jgi:hypothetical protein
MAGGRSGFAVTTNTINSQPVGAGGAPMIRAGVCSGFDGRNGLARLRVFLGTSAVFIHCKRSDDSLPPPVHVRRHGHARRLNHVWRFPDGSFQGRT